LYRTKYSDWDFQRVLIKCRSLPPVFVNYLVYDYVENLLLTVLDFQLRGTTIERAMNYYHQHAQAEIPNFTALKNLLAAHPDTHQGNQQLAQYLWGYNYWNRIELLRRLVTYFEARNVTNQAQLKQWASAANFERDFKGKIKGAGLAIFQWLVMRQGVETVQPDTWIHRFIHDVLGYTVSDETAVELLEEVAQEIGIKAYELDWRIWTYQRSRS
jgi:hypothetical protein